LLCNCLYFKFYFIIMTEHMHNKICTKLLVFRNKNCILSHKWNIVQSSQTDFWVYVDKFNLLGLENLFYKALKYLWIFYKRLSIFRLVLLSLFLYLSLFVSPTYGLWDESPTKMSNEDASHYVSVSSEKHESIYKQQIMLALLLLVWLIIGSSPLFLTRYEIETDRD